LENQLNIDFCFSHRAGKTYRLSFLMKNEAEDPVNLAIAVDTAAVITLIEQSGNSSNGFRRRTGRFVATQANETLSIALTRAGHMGTLFLDDVAITPGGS
jgi:hypothetical protein